MAEPHHSFCVTSSFGQRLSLVVFVAVCSTSLLFLPTGNSTVLFAVKAFIILMIVCFILGEFYRLKTWQLSFVLDRKGQGRLASGECFQVQGKMWITPFACLLGAKFDSQHRLYIIWADMLSDNDYRHLCRLLLNIKNDKASR